MKIILTLLAGALLLAACGKKAPLRPPGEEPNDDTRAVETEAR
jgi:predicted small lipoprotein YifL